MSRGDTKIRNIQLEEHLLSKEVCDSELEGILVSNRHTKCPNEIRNG